MLAANPGPQLGNLDALLTYVAVPFERNGYEVSIFSVTYESGREDLIRQRLGSRLKMLRLMKFEGSSQGKNALANFDAFAEYVETTRTWFSLVLLMRYEFHFTSTFVGVVNRSNVFNEAYVMHQKWRFPNSLSKAWWCVKLWPLADPNASRQVNPTPRASWWAAPDFWHFLSSKTLGCFVHMLRQAGEAHWPSECIGPWGEYIRKFGCSLVPIGDSGIMIRVDNPRPPKLPKHHR